jgi:hypothetical protein
MMIRWLDPFYKSIPASALGVERAAPHYRKIYGAGRDEGY